MSESEVFPRSRIDQILVEGANDHIVRRVASYCLDHGVPWYEIESMPAVTFTGYVSEKHGVVMPENIDRMVELAKFDLLAEQLAKMPSEVDYGEA